jgi:Domain of unknown function (DUF4440)
MPAHRPAAALVTGQTRRMDELKAKLSLLGLCLLMVSVPSASSQGAAGNAAKPTGANAEKEVITLSKDKWQWMAERNVEALDKLFAEEAVFVHMGGTMTKSQELDTIKSGRIQYKDAQIQEVSVRFVGTTAILLNRIRLVAVVGGNEVVNPFTVTEVYVQQGGAWKLASLSFTRMMTP